MLQHVLIYGHLLCRDELKKPEQTSHHLWYKEIVTFFPKYKQLMKSHCSKDLKAQ
jgi:hypothetical protein